MLRASAQPTAISTMTVTIRTGVPKPGNSSRRYE
jgi:hypothetical protein